MGPAKVIDGIGDKIRRRLGDICTEELECEMLELESLCEDIVSDRFKRAAMSRLSLREKWKRVKERRKRKRKIRILIKMMGEWGIYFNNLSFNIYNTEKHLFKRVLQNRKITNVLIKKEVWKCHLFL